MEHISLSFSLLMALWGGALLVSYVLTASLVAFAEPVLRRRCASGIRIAALEAHRLKSSTPTGGGILVAASMLIVILGAAAGGYLPLGRGLGAALIATVLLFGGIGLVDDLSKIRKQGGISEATKWYGQWIAAFLILILWNPAPLAYLHAVGVPPTLWGVLTWLWYALLMVGVSNAVNLTDGLDGLAGGVITLNALWYGMVAVLCSSRGIIESLAPLIGAAALAGAMGAFWGVNRWPARIFMGDTGSLMAGAVLALLACSLHLEWFLVLTAVIPLLETASVIIQVGWYRVTGRRVFRMAPIHHHFEALGVPERQIVRGSHALTLGGLLLASALLYGLYF